MEPILARPRQTRSSATLTLVSGNSKNSTIDSRSNSGRSLPSARPSPSELQRSSMLQILNDLQLLALYNPLALEFLADVTTELVASLRAADNGDTATGPLGRT
jgi:hypothetical protein